MPCGTGFRRVQSRACNRDGSAFGLRGTVDLLWYGLGGTPFLREPRSDVLLLHVRRVVKPMLRGPCNFQAVCQEIRGFWGKIAICCTEATALASAPPFSSSAPTATAATATAAAFRAGCAASEWGEGEVGATAFLIRDRQKERKSHGKSVGHTLLCSLASESLAPLAPLGATVAGRASGAAVALDSVPAVSRGRGCIRDRSNHVVHALSPRRRLP